MAAPAVTSIAFDKQAYNPGDPITVTVTGQAGSNVTTRTVNGTATFTDAATGLTSTLTGLATITSAVEDTTTAGFADTDSRPYALASVSQTPAGLVTAVFKAVA